MRRSIYVVLGLWLGLTGSSLWALGVGDSAPSFARPALAGGERVDLAQYRGQVLYVDFWASWCGPCRVSLPAMDEIYRELGPEGFSVIAINVEENIGDARDFLQAHPVSYPVARDDGSLPAAYGVKGMPTAYLIDRQGHVRAVHEGFRRGDAKKLREQIAALLKEPLLMGANP